MTRRPEFGVIIPTRNRSDRLRRALKSVAEQDADDWEVLIVDDASSPPHLQQVRGSAAADPRVRLIELPHRMGAAAARNRGAGECQCRWLAFMDDDCWWPRDRLLRLHRALHAAPEYRHAYTRMFSVTPDGRCWVQGTAHDSPFPAPWQIGTPMLVVERKLFHRVGGFDVELPRLQDFDLALRLNSAAPALFVPDAVLWTERIGGISEDRAAFGTATTRLARKYDGGSWLNSGERALMHRLLAYRSMELGARRLAVRHYRSAVRHQSGKLVHWAGLIAALAGVRPYRFAARMAGSRRADPGEAEPVPPVPPALRVEARPGLQSTSEHQAIERP